MNISNDEYERVAFHDRRMYQTDSVEEDAQKDNGHSSKAPATKRIGVAKGKFTVPDDFDDDRTEIEQS